MFFRSGFCKERYCYVNISQYATQGEPNLRSSGEEFVSLERYRYVNISQYEVMNTG